jgi:hypothetical protein
MLFRTPWRLTVIICLLTFVSISAKAAAPAPGPVDNGLRALARLAAVPEAESQHRVAIAALEGLAFLASGSDSTAGPFHRQVRDDLDFIEANTRDTGLMAAKDEPAPMYSHGYATLFMAELLMKTKDDSLRPRLQKAVALINSSVSKEGGWRYLPEPHDADVSVTACVLNALLAARAAGIPVDAKVIAGATAYVTSCQVDDGGFSYMAGQGKAGASGLPRSAAAIAVLLHGGAKPSDQSISRGIQYVLQHLEAPKPSLGQEGHFFYGAYYASQWFPFVDDATRKTYASLQNRITTGQQADGTWAGQMGPEYTTASALIVLQSPQKKLWIFEANR